jgi:hypothetical protein
MTAFRIKAEVTWALIENQSGASLVFMAENLKRPLQPAVLTLKSLFNSKYVYVYESHTCSMSSERHHLFLHTLVTIF